MLWQRVATAFALVPLVVIGILYLDTAIHQIDASHCRYARWAGCR